MMYQSLTRAEVDALKESALGRKYLREYAKAERYLQEAARITGVVTDPEKITLRPRLRPGKMAEPLTREVTRAGKGLVHVPYADVIRKELDYIKRIGVVSNPDKATTKHLRASLQGYAYVAVDVPGVRETDVAYVRLPARERYIRESKKTEKELRKTLKEVGGEETEVDEIITANIQPVERLVETESLRAATKRMRSLRAKYHPAKAETAEEYYNQTAAKSSVTYSVNYTINNYLKVVAQIESHGDRGAKISKKFYEALSEASFGQLFNLYVLSEKRNKSLYEKIWDSKNEVDGSWNPVYGVLEELLEKAGHPVED